MNNRWLDLEAGEQTSSAFQQSPKEWRYFPSSMRTLNAIVRHAAPEAETKANVIDYDNSVQRRFTSSRLHSLAFNDLSRIRRIRR